MVVQPREHHALEDSTECDPVVEHVGWDRGLAVGDGRAEHLPDDGLERRGERRPIGDLRESGAHWPGRKQVVDQRGDIGTERCVRREQGVHPPARPGHVDHADVVQVRKPDAETLHELLPVWGTTGQEDAVDRVQQFHESDRDVPDVDDAVVGEDRWMGAGICEEPRVVAQDFERGLGLDRPPEPFLEIGPDVAGQIAVEFRELDPSPPSTHSNRTGPARRDATASNG